ncbi:hypothetical protein F5Y15DRAFT_353221 [Xylariaceae sp. FL0016]|nr:hypothetical protein F5Y15DRAFT_353221 [Xylariaceae sp. FL0016]
MRTHTSSHMSERVPLPPSVPPPLIIASLQQFSPILSNHYMIRDFRSRSLTPDEVVSLKQDPFFGTGLDPEDNFAAFDVKETLDLVPHSGLLERIDTYRRLRGQERVYPAIGQRVPGGVRFRIRSNCGVETKGEFRVVRRSGWDVYGDDCVLDTGKVFLDAAKREKKGGVDGGIVGEDSSYGEPEWDIICECEVESPLYGLPGLPCVKRANAKLCRHLCEKMISHAVHERSWM